MTSRTRAGRPPLAADGTPSKQAVVRLTVKQFDQLYHRAAIARISIAEQIRRDIRRGARDAATDPRIGNGKIRME